MSFYISIDPGKNKCGLLLADIQSGEVVAAGIASLNKFSDLVSCWNKNYNLYSKTKLNQKIYLMKLSLPL